MGRHVRADDLDHRRNDDDAMNDAGDEHEANRPSCCRGRRNLAAGAVKLLQAEIGLGVLEDREAVAARRAACEACERWEHGRCWSCGGCYTWAKTRLTAERCPLDRWPALAST